MMQWVSAVMMLAQETGSGPAPGPARPAGMEAFLVQFGPIILIVVVFLWLMHRSQKKKDQERNRMLSSIQPKDKVVTIGGIHGRVVNVKENVFVVRVDDDKDVRLTVSKNAVSRKTEDKPSEEEGV